MRNSFDWTPYRRSTVGFDRLFDFLETGGSGAENYPPFDIEKVADDHFRITVAVAGFKADRQGNIYTGPSTEDTPALVEPAAFSDGIVIVQVNEIVDDPADLPRVDFFHWILIDLPASVRQLATGEYSREVTPRGKAGPAAPHGTRQGINDYTGWFSGDHDMRGDYYGYDGPCPPWNDERMHRYVFTVYALDIERLPIEGRFTGAEAGVGPRRLPVQASKLWWEQAGVILAGRRACDGDEPV